MNEKLKLLIQNDPILGRFIGIVGELSLSRRNDHYVSLIKSIIGQQLSVKAAGTIFGRFVDLLEQPIIPEKVMMVSEDELRAIGVSRPKITYIKDLSQKIIAKKLVLEQLEELSNEEVITSLTSIKGVGTWTAEMFLLFSLGRENVLSLLDVGLHRGAKWLYNSEDGKRTLIEKGDCWAPYQSLASLYLWEAVNRGFVINYKSFEEYYSNL